MSEKRYFYTDPLAADWMVKHFGMEFEHRGIRDENSIYIIHPDSLHLLEPQVGDLVTVNDAQDAHIAFHQDFIDALKANYTLFSHPVRSIQRNAILFMWPESEEV